MKKLYFIILLSFIFHFWGISQNVRFGIIGGGNLLGLSGPESPENYNKQYGFSAGIFIDTRTTEYMSTQIEVNFSQFNFEFLQNIENIENAYFNIKERNDYITVPVYLKYKRGYEIAFYYLLAGMQAGVLINHDRDVVATSRGLEIDETTYYNYTHNWYDYGLSVGGGFQFKPITIGIIYYHSMRNLYTKDDAWEMRYRSFSLNISYQLNYKEHFPYGRKTGWKGLKHKLKKMF